MNLDHNVKYNQAHPKLAASQQGAIKLEFWVKLFLQYY